MKKYAIACLISGAVGLALGGHLIDRFPDLQLSPQARAGQTAAETVVRGERSALTPGQLARYSPEERQNILVYDVANPSVVNISTQSVVYDGFFGMEGTSEGSGSGSVLDKQGHILTNFHVVDGAQRVEVTLANGKSYPARLVGHDKIDDLAVLQVEAPPAVLHPINFGDSADLKVGQRVYALGNPFGWERTMTTGIISGLNRTLPSRDDELRTMKALIQTDAAMNPGNSGGPLLDSSARMIGMNVAIATGRARQNSGVGFAIPVNRIKRQVQELIEYGRVTRGDIGITQVMIADEGIIAADLVKDGPAEEAGLRPMRIVRERLQRGYRTYVRERYDVEHADIITAIDGEPVHSASEFVDAIESRKPGESVTLSIFREGRARTLEVTLGAS
jgi:S1-C subfamily serine protease